MINKAIQRLHWRFSSGKAFTPNENDIDALNEIITHVNDSKKSFNNNNILFTKLFIYAYGEFLKKYDCSIFDNTAELALLKMLNLPMDIYISRFTNHLNEYDWEQLMNQLDINIGHPSTISEEKSQEDLEKLIVEIEKNPDSKLAFLQQTWSEDDVRKNLLTMAYKAFIKFNYGA